jgi:hypothetical protein
MPYDGINGFVMARERRRLQWLSQRRVTLNLSYPERNSTLAVLKARRELIEVLTDSSGHLHI